MKTRVLVKHGAGPGGLELEESEVPRLAANDVLVRIQRAAICGTDLHLYRWNSWAAGRYALPVPLGHEFVGEVVEIGSAVGAVERGQRVVAETHMSCGRCRQCRSNRRHTCLDLKLFSTLGRGCFADFTVVPEVAVRGVPTAIPLEYACIMEPLGIAVRAARHADIGGGVLLVVGCGPLGLFSIGAAKALGAARVLASDVSEFRLDLAARVGANVVIDGRTTTLQKAVSATTGGEMADVAIDTSGSPGAIAQALGSVSPGGRLLVLGLPAAPVALDLSGEVVLREIGVQGLYGRLIDETWLQVERLLLARRLPVDAVLTHTLRLDDYDKAFQLAAAGQAGKVLLTP